MKQIILSESTFQTLIESLESAILVCEKVDYTLSKKEKNLLQNVEKTAPYALGYTKSTLHTLKEQLKSLKSNETLQG